MALKKSASKASSRPRSSTPARDTTSTAGTLLSFFAPAPSPSSSSSKGVGASGTSLKRKASTEITGSSHGTPRVRTKTSGTNNRKDADKSAARSEVIDLCDDSPEASPFTSTKSKGRQPAQRLREVEDEDVFAMPFAVPSAAIAVPKEGEDFIHPPELSEGDDDDEWDGESVGSVTMRGESVDGDFDDAQTAELWTVGNAKGSTTSTGAGGVPSCPICRADLSRWVTAEAEKHVNHCLDNLGGDSEGRSFSTASTSRTANLKVLKSSTTPKPVPGSYKTTASRAPLGKPLAPPKTSSTTPVAGSSKSPDAFTALMMGHAQDKAWKKAEKDHVKGRFQGKREAPFYKIVEGMPIAVDAFRYGAIPGVKAYFLSHAHSDHYTNLSGSWCHGPVYCSLTTGNLIKHNLGVKAKWVKTIPENIPTVIEGVTVTLLDANHCPGSSIFLFEGPHTLPSSPYSKTPSRIFRYLHCGDFRASPAHLRHPALKGKKIDICYLDTTYLNPKYCFPAQQQVIDACADLVKQRLDGDKGALRRGLRGDGSLRKSGEAMAGWLEAGRAKSEAEERPDELVEGENFGVDAESDEFGGKEEVDDDEKAMWEALEFQGGEEATADQNLGSELERPETKSASSASDPTDIRTTPQLFTSAAPLTKVNSGVKPEHQSAPEERFCILVGTYSIGKERIVKGIARAINSKIYCNDHKWAIFMCIDDPELHSLMTKNPREAQVHVTNLFAIKKDTLEDYLDQYKGHFTRIIGLRPTGWSFRSEGKEEKMPSISKTLAVGSKRGFSSSYLYPQRDSTERCQAYGVPYSEHSSFFELTSFCLSLDWVRIIPTVNVGNPGSRAKMKAWFDRWQAERKRRREAGEGLFIEPRDDNYW